MEILLCHVNYDIYRECLPSNLLAGRELTTTSSTPHVTEGLYSWKMVHNRISCNLNLSQKLTICCFSCILCLVFFPCMNSISEFLFHISNVLVVICEFQKGKFVTGINPSMILYCHISTARQNYFLDSAKLRGWVRTM